jgi:hypothetical protein
MLAVGEAHPPNGDDEQTGRHAFPACRQLCFVRAFRGVQVPAQVVGERDADLLHRYGIHTCDLQCCIDTLPTVGHLTQGLLPWWCSRQCWCLTSQTCSLNT